MYYVNNVWQLYFSYWFCFYAILYKNFKETPEDMYEKVDEMNEAKEVCRDHSVWPSVFSDNLARYKA